MSGCGLTLSWLPTAIPECEAGFFGTERRHVQRATRSGGPRSDAHAESTPSHRAHTHSPWTVWQHHRVPSRRACERMGRTGVVLQCYSVRHPRMALVRFSGRQHWPSSLRRAYILNTSEGQAYHHHALSMADS